MADNKITIDTDSIVRYFTNMTTDLIIAYAVLVVGIVALILGFVL